MLATLTPRPRPTTEGATAMTPPPKPHPDMPARQYVEAMAARYNWEQARKKTRDANRDIDWSAELRRMQTRDQPAVPGLGGYAHQAPDQSEMGSAPTQNTGGELVMVLPTDRLGN
jgi:hypothetical protein